MISRDQSLKPAIVILIVCFPTLSFNEAGARPSQRLKGCIRKSSYQLARVRVGSAVEDLSDFS